jgi:hypothetical protein
MHRATPQNVAFRSYTAGGARGVAGKVDDSKYMQEVTANFMKGEQRSRIEAPQNYGFTSVHMSPDADGSGAEHFSSFIGGSRGFPIASAIDDRRHRLYNMQEGDVAMYRTASDQLQLHLAQDGGYWTGPDSKKLRLQLIQGQRDGQQQGGSSGGSSSGSSSSSTGQSGQMGQQPLYQQDSKQFTEVNGTMTVHVNKQHQIVLQDKQTGMEVNPDNKVYLGATKDKGSFLPVLLQGGVPAKNVMGQVGSLADLEVAERAAAAEAERIVALERTVEVLTARIANLEARMM